jgi:hypothetical protein
LKRWYRRNWRLYIMIKLTIIAIDILFYTQVFYIAMLQAL